MIPRTVKAPFPWFGGKSKVAAQVWERFGNVPNYVEPFAGSLAVLLARPHSPRVETINDIDCWIANFWRALQSAPEAVAEASDWPVNEADLHARHLWLVNQSEWRERMKTDPDFYDAKIAGWWCWGICQWIGSGWCCEPNWRGRTNAGRHARGLLAVQEKRPLLSGHSGGVGVHRKMVYAGRDERGPLSRTNAKRPRLGRGQGRGVSRQLPQLSGDGSGSGRGVLGVRGQNAGLYEWLESLSERLRRVRVCCGEWDRVLGPSVTEKIGLTGVFLDPPYDMRVVSNEESQRDGAAPSGKLYEHHDNDLSRRVREWAISNGNNPLLRIAVCGYEGEHEFPKSWECVAWKANGGFANHKGEMRGKVNAHRERIWFSPHCIKTPSLFGSLQGANEQLAEAVETAEESAPPIEAFLNCDDQSTVPINLFP